jgi:hypothetical protein
MFTNIHTRCPCRSSRRATIGRPNGYQPINLDHLPPLTNSPKMSTSIRVRSHSQTPHYTMATSYTTPTLDELHNLIENQEAQIGSMRRQLSIDVNNDCVRSNADPIPTTLTMLRQSASRRRQPIYIRFVRGGYLWNTNRIMMCLYKVYPNM